MSQSLVCPICEKPGPIYSYFQHSWRCCGYHVDFIDGSIQFWKKNFLISGNLEKTTIGNPLLKQTKTINIPIKYIESLDDKTFLKFWKNNDWERLVKARTFY